MEPKHRVLDLFAGAGGMTLGFVDSRFCGKFESVLGIDSNADAIATFNRNFGTHGVSTDVKGWLRAHQTPEADVVIGGPPCQGFSLLNKKRDGDKRRSLWKPFLKVVEASGAKAFVIENVRDLHTSPERKEIEKVARRMGFSCWSGVLNAADFGTPQVRFRTFIIGVKGIDPDRIAIPKPTHASAPVGILRPWLTVRDAIGGLPKPEGMTIRNIKAPLDLHFGRTPTPMSLARYRVVPPGGNRFDLQANAPQLTPQCWIRKKSGGTDLFGRLWWERPSVTIRTEFYKPEKGRYLHPVQHRPITHREAARLMGFPDDFEFCGTKIEIAKQIGNAVPPPLAGAIAHVIATMLDSLASSSAA